LEDFNVGERGCGKEGRKYIYFKIYTKKPTFLLTSG
jgi:hypothetical protein